MINRGLCTPKAFFFSSPQPPCNRQAFVFSPCNRTLLVGAMLIEGKFFQGDHVR